jgi:DnaJ family protein C protein 17
VRFREISLSIEILSDPAKRTYVDTRLETDRKRKEKYAQSDKKRKDMIDVRPCPSLSPPSHLL